MNTAKTFCFDNNIEFYLPGPASTVEERSLRNRFLKGTAVRSPPKAIFSGAIIRNMFDGKPTTRTGSSNHATLTGQLSQLLHCMKRNVTLKNGL